MNKKLSLFLVIVCLFSITGCSSGSKVDNKSTAQEVEIKRITRAYNADVKALAIDRALENANKLVSSMDAYFSDESVIGIDITGFDSSMYVENEAQPMRNEMISIAAEQGITLQQFAEVALTHQVYECLDDGSVYVIYTLAGETKLYELTCVLKGGALYEVYSN